MERGLGTARPRTRHGRAENREPDQQFDRGIDDRRMLGLGLDPAVGCPLKRSLTLAVLDSDVQLTKSIFFPSPLLKGNPHCEPVARAIADTTARRMPSDVTSVSHLFPLERILIASPSLLNRPNRSWSLPDSPSQPNNALHGRKDKNAGGVDLVWLVDYLDEVSNKWSPFPSLRSTQGSFPDLPSGMSDNRLSRLREI